MLTGLTASDIFASEDALNKCEEGRSSDFRIVLPGSLPILMCLRTVVSSRIVPGYSGGPVTVFHRLPLTLSTQHYIRLSDRV